MYEIIMQLVRKCMEYVWNNNAICIGLHPGTVKTQFTKNYHNRVESVSAERSVDMLMSVLQKIKYADNGQVFAYDGSVIPW